MAAKQFLRKQIQAFGSTPPPLKMLQAFLLAQTDGMLFAWSIWQEEAKARREEGGQLMQALDPKYAIDWGESWNWDEWTD